MKKGKKAPTVQVEVYYGFVPVSKFIEKRWSILKKHSPSPLAAKQAHLEQIADDANALIALYAAQPGLHQAIRPEGATEPMLPWIALSTELDEVLFQLKAIGSEITAPCLPSDLLPLVEGTLNSDMRALQAFVLSRQPSLAGDARGHQLWQFNKALAPVLPFKRAA